MARPVHNELEELAYEIGKLRPLGRRLEFSETKLDELEAARKQLSESVYHMLLRWKQGKSYSATYKVLCDALEHKHVQRKDLADKFCYINGKYTLQC